MKKFLALVLFLATVFSCVACSGSGSDATTGNNTAAFSVGYGRENITPELPYELSGYEDGIQAEGVKDYIYASCVAISDADNNTVLLFSFDLGSAQPEFVNMIKNSVSAKTGISPDNIFVAATHIHSAPYCLSGPVTAIAPDMAAKAAQTALDDRLPADIYIGTSYTENLNFVRHYVMDDGSVVGDNYGIATGKKYAGHTTQADNQMQLIKFTREGGKDIVLMNWQSHPHVSGSTNKYVTADIIGACRTSIESSQDCNFIYFQGGGGNINGRSRIAEENITEKPDFKAHGQALAKAAVKGLKDMKKVEAGPIVVNNVNYTGKIRQTPSDVLAAVPTFQSVLEETGSREKAVAATGGLVNSVFTISGIKKRAAAGETLDIPISAISIGDISFVTASYEMFDTNAKFIKENTPYEMTFVMAYCNGHYGYIPSAEAFEYGCYEKDNGYFAEGTGEDIANNLVGMLKELHK